ncbi:hypothetical protein GIW81_02315 [Hyphomicrobium sp. xq]|uniref:Uncharacterized protein n=1 Tax=Hyphomicrobium album TaxID=2665159 RepID=A0A6I3KCJ3_9HYPH|nr:hypothetical protein [Hyphomicrobium album]MTD93165.1 hypothetical protein [Hyphomicrobium album]
MTDNPDYGTALFQLLAKAEAGETAPLDAYLAADPARAATADRQYVLVARNQFGAEREGRWYAYSAQPDRNPWPGTSARTALVLLRRDPSGTLSWHEFTLPEGTWIDAISAKGSTFIIRAGGVDVTTTGDELFRVIADGAFGPPGFSKAEIARGLDKLVGRAPLDVVGPAEPGAILGSALPLILDDRVLGTFTFRPERPAHYNETSEYGPSCSLFADPSGNFAPALARAREVIPGLAAQVASGAHLVQEANPDFGKADAPRLASATFRPDGIVEITIDDDDAGSVSADLELGTDGKLRLIEIDDT